MFRKSVDTKYNDNCSIAEFELLSAQTTTEKAHSGSAGKPLTTQ